MVRVIARITNVEELRASKYQGCKVVYEASIDTASEPTLLCVTDSVECDSEAEAGATVDYYNSARAEKRGVSLKQARARVRNEDN